MKSMSLIEENELNGEESLSPLIKWPGGKRALIGHLKKKTPSAFNRYFEPFFGGGALFFSIRPTLATLSDKNEELVNCYVQVRDHAEDLIKRLRTLKNSEQDYYNVRDWNPKTELLRAARFIYLTTLSFNGIYRVNLKGTFNVPYGYKTHLATCDESRIRAITSGYRRRYMAKSSPKLQHRKQSI
jgi:DNA adenine methylase